jgi:Zn-dependent protease
LNKTQLLVLMIPVILFSLTVHEYSHGKMALLLGDDTAKRLGRLSFNPMRHLDILGVLFFYFVGFGWAKPVPVDPRNFVSPRRDMMYVAIAGPLSNIALAVGCSIFICLIPHPILPLERGLSSLTADFSYLFVILAYGIWINVALAIFNMLPMYPLDGSSVLKGMVSQKIAEKITNLDRFGAFLILGVFLLDHFAHTRILGTILMLPINYSYLFLSPETFPMIIKVLMVRFA